MAGSGAEAPTIDVDAVARAVRQCPSVARLTAGRGVEAVAYLPGRRVEGIRVVDGHLEVHVVAQFGPSMPKVAEEVRLALRSVVGDAPVSVVIQDLELEPERGEDTGGAGG